MIKEKEISMTIEKLTSEEKDDFVRLFLTKHHVVKVKIKKNIREILEKKFNKEGYKNEKSEKFFAKYAGKKVFVYFNYEDWFIISDNNHILTEDCFEKL